MHCPSCRAELEEEAIADGTAERFCPACGWGRDRVLQRKIASAGGLAPETPDRRVPAGVWLKLALAWPASVAFVLGPYLAMTHGFPLLAEQQNWGFLHVTSQGMAEKLNPYYWIAAAVYVALAALVTPSVDVEDLGLWGTFINNPFSYEDDYNRLMLKIAALLAPGKLIWFTLWGTVRVVGRILLGR